MGIWCKNNTQGGIYLYNRVLCHKTVGVEDPMQHGRGVALADFNRDGKTDIVYGNWNGPHRLYMQLNNRKQKFKVGSNAFPGYLTTIHAHKYHCVNVGLCIL